MTETNNANAVQTPQAQQPQQQQAATAATAQQQMQYPIYSAKMTGYANPCLIQLQQQAGNNDDSESDDEEMSNRYVPNNQRNFYAPNYGGAEMVDRNRNVFGDMHNVQQRKNSKCVVYSIIAFVLLLAIGGLTVGIYFGVTKGCGENSISTHGAGMPVSTTQQPQQQQSAFRPVAQQQPTTIFIQPASHSSYTHGPENSGCCTMRDACCAAGTAVGAYVAVAVVIPVLVATVVLATTLGC